MLTTNATNTEEKALLEKLENQVERGYRILQKGNVKLGQFRMWIGPVRAQLRKLYGRDSDILNLLPQIKGKVPAEAVEPLFSKRIQQLETFINSVSEVGSKSFGASSHGKVFIGHGRSPVWRELKDFIFERLGLPWDEFNREVVAGLTTLERLSQMLGDASFAFLIMTAEDEHTDLSLHARENVIHEVGLFQGRLGSPKAIILLEEDCNEFSNIIGLSQIRFPKGHISTVFEEIRRVLEREKVLET